MVSALECETSVLCSILSSGELIHVHYADRHHILKTYPLGTVNCVSYSWVSWSSIFGHYGLKIKPLNTFSVINGIRRSLRISFKHNYTYILGVNRVNHCSVLWGSPFHVCPQILSEQGQTIKQAINYNWKEHFQEPRVVKTSWLSVVYQIIFRPLGSNPNNSGVIFCLSCP